MSESDGGPAYSSTPFQPSADANSYRGMSLRDWFAGQALEAKSVGSLIAYEDHSACYRAKQISRLVRDCYDIADAMLVQREIKADG